MEDIIKSIMLEYEKSSFLIDLIKHESGYKFVKITQKIYESKITNELNINPTILTDLISVLEQFKNEIENISQQNSLSYFSDQRQKSIIDRYLKGVTIEDLALQFDCSVEIINQILYNKGIKIVDNKMPKKYRKSNYTQKKRF
ncbi:MAG: hypothetical protein EAZ53_04250 [Bacteroidetes bacterium]|nr:MAG: hypothetical protein EAZ53_04250 [Bacteroidota bacterium]